MTAAMPTRDELGPNEVFVQVRSEPDSLNRRRFTAFWIDDVKPNGVAGQVFHTSLEKFTADCERDGKKVRYWTPEEGVL